LVSWYSGPGWIGWSPLGVLGGTGLLTTVPGSVVQNGLLISSATVSRLPSSAGTRIARMPFEPGAGAMLSGSPLSADAEASFAAHDEAPHSSAPAAILMGGNGRLESSLHASHSQPLRVRLGTTLGGSYAVGGAVGEFRGDAFAGGRGIEGKHALQGPNAGPVGPTIMPHGQRASSNSPQMGGGDMMPSGGGGNSGSLAPSMGNASAEHSSPSSAGGHH
jgi:hypothetical protein